jgi:serine/threonine protein kinase
MKWTRASDVYSFGVVVFEVFSEGGFPFSSFQDDRFCQVLTDRSSHLDELLFAPVRAKVPTNVYVPFMKFLLLLLFY